MDIFQAVHKAYQHVPEDVGTLYALTLCYFQNALKNSIDFAVLEKNNRASGFLSGQTGSDIVCVGFPCMIMQNKMTLRMSY